MSLSTLILSFLGHLCTEHKEWWTRSSCPDFKRAAWRTDTAIVVRDQRENPQNQTENRQWQWPQTHDFEPTELCGRAWETQKGGPQ